MICGLYVKAKRGNEGGEVCGVGVKFGKVRKRGRSEGGRASSQASGRVCRLSGGARAEDEGRTGAVVPWERWREAYEVVAWGERVAGCG